MSLIPVIVKITGLSDQSDQVIRLNAFHKNRMRNATLVPPDENKTLRSLHALVDKLHLNSLDRKAERLLALTGLLESDYPMHIIQTVDLLLELSPSVTANRTFLPESSIVNDMKQKQEELLRLTSELSKNTVFSHLPHWEAIDNQSDIMDDIPQQTIQSHREQSTVHDLPTYNIIINDQDRKIIRQAQELVYWNKSDQTTIDDSIAIREIIFALRQLPSEMIATNTTSNLSNLKLERITDATLHALLSECAQRVTSITKIKSFCSQLFDIPSTCLQKLSLAQRQHIVKFEEKLILLENEIQQQTTAHHTVLSFTNWISDMTDSISLLDMLNSELESFVFDASLALSVKTAKTLNVIYSLLKFFKSNHQKDDLSHVVQHILFETLAPYLDIIRSWLADGANDDVHSETFLRGLDLENKKKLWSDQLNVDEQEIPFFCQGIANQILEIGKTRYLTGQRTPFIQLDTLFEELLDQDPLLDMDHIVDTFKHDMMESAQMNLNVKSYLSTFPTPPESLFQLAHAFYFMMDGEAMHLFSNRLFDLLLGNEMVDSLKLNVLVDDAFQDRVGPSGIQLNPANHLVLSYALEDEHFVPPLKMIEAIETQFHVGWPFHLVIRPEHVSIYELVFKMLLKLKLIKRLLEVDCFPTRTNDGRQLGKLKGLKVGGEMQYLSKRVSMRMQMLHFVSALERHVFLHVLETERNKFVEKWSSIQDMQSLIGLHSQFVETIRDKCLLNPRAHVLQTAVEKILGLALEFREFCVASDHMQTQLDAIAPMTPLKRVNKFPSMPLLKPSISLSHWRDQQHTETNKKNSTKPSSGVLGHAELNTGINVPVLERTDLNEMHDKFVDMRQFLVDTLSQLGGRGAEHCKFPISLLFR